MVDTYVAWCSPVLINAPSIINAASAIRTRKMVSALISLFFSLFSKLFLLEFDWLKRLTAYREGEELRTTHLNGAAFQGDRLASRRSSQADRNCKFACVCNGTLTGTGAIIAIEYCIQLYTFSSSVILLLKQISIYLCTLAFLRGAMCSGCHWHPFSGSVMLNAV